MTGRMAIRWAMLLIVSLFLLAKLIVAEAMAASRRLLRLHLRLQSTRFGCNKHSSLLSVRAIQSRQCIGQDWLFTDNGDGLCVC